ncbi:MAG: ribbon-helix-helix domain-containing protein [Candidatus Heimdallarchaeota archaeon]
MTTISVSLDEELLEWLDQLIERGVIKSRSEAVRGGILTATETFSIWC